MTSCHDSSYAFVRYLKHKVPVEYRAAFMFPLLSTVWFFFYFLKNTEQNIVLEVSKTFNGKTVVSRNIECLQTRNTVVLILDGITMKVVITRSDIQWVSKKSSIFDRV